MVGWNYIVIIIYLLYYIIIFNILKIYVYSTSLYIILHYLYLLFGFIKYDKMLV